jgi:hypothetical protein
MGIRSALPDGMELYEVKAPGIRHALNSVEISHLFRSGHLHRRLRCRPAGETNWRTIGELFPLLEYGFGSYSLPAGDSKPVGRRRAFALLALLIAAGVYVYWDRSARNSTSVRSVAEATDRRADAPIVSARSN